MAKISVAINGFGRIGRTFFKTIWEHPEMEVVAINDVANAATLAHLLKYDSIHGIFKAQISSDSKSITVNNNTIAVQCCKDLNQLSWPNIDVVIESTGKYKTKSELQKHLKAGAARVILSVPAQDDSIPMVVMGVNQDILTPQDHIVSNASCTTNNAAPMVQLIDTLCGIDQAYITTIHSYTTDQSLHDQPHRDLRRARAAGQSIVPTTTGAAKALTKIFPNLADAIGGCGIRVPVANGSLTDITFNVKRDVTIAQINQAFKEASQGELAGILSYTNEPIVSVDIIGNTHSCVFDSDMTSVIGRLVKIIGWYDNEVGYSNRLVDLVLHICKK